MMKIIRILFLVCIGFYRGYAQDPWSALNQYLRFDDLENLDQLWLLEERCDVCDSSVVMDTVMLHVRREGRRVIMEKVSGSDDFPFNMASVGVDSISHMDLPEHMGLVHQTRFRLSVDTAGSLPGGHVLGILQHKQMLHFMPSVANINPDKMHSEASRIRTYELVRSSPFDRPDRSMVVPIHCIESTGKWKVIKSSVKPYPFDSIVIDLRHEYVDVKLISKKGDTIVSMSILNGQIHQGYDSWSYGCTSSKGDDGGYRVACKVRFSGATSTLGYAQVLFNTMRLSGTAPPSYISWNGLAARVSP